MPWTIIELALRLAILLLEGIPPEQRRATAIVWWNMWWPIGKLWVKDKGQREQIDAMMAKAAQSPGPGVEQVANG